MKIVLASYFEPENHGTGRKIGISPSKPNNLDYDCPLVFKDLSPDSDSFFEYKKNKDTDPVGAGSKFVNEYHSKLKRFCAALPEDKNPLEVIELYDGDTLLSWEKKGNMSYRQILSEYLSSLGYDVELN